MSLDCSNPRHVAGLDHRDYCNRRRDAQSLYPANLGSGWVPRTGSGDDWHSCRVAMGTCGRHPIACRMEFVRGCSNASSERAELVCECPRATGGALRGRRTTEALRRKAPIGLALEPVPGPSARTSPATGARLPTPSEGSKSTCRMPPPAQKLSQMNAQQKQTSLSRAASEEQST